MQIAADKVVSIEYTLKNDKDEVLDTSQGGQPLVYLHGRGNLVPGLEKALDGKAAGDAVEVVLPPEQGYGLHEPKLIQRMQVRRLPEQKAQVGLRFRAMTDAGPRFFLVTAVAGDYATVDGNHPLVGMTLHFAVKIADVRDATAEELAHGHVHGTGGHQH